MVGPVAAQSLGEANTQLTLNTFHSAGAAAGSVVVTAGLPRMKEIINLSKSMKVPSMRLFLKGEYSTSSSKAEEIQNKIEFTKLRDVVEKTEIIYEKVDEEGLNVSNSEDMEFVKLYYEFNEIVGCDRHNDLSKWVLRIKFDREAMASKKIMMNDIQDAIYRNSQRDDDIQCIISDDNSSNLIMRIRVKSETEDEYFISFLKELEKQILDMSLRGIENVKSGSNLEDRNLIVYDPDGSYKTVKEWVINTNGSNLRDAMLMDNIDKERSVTNDIMETFEIFGIEGVRIRIIKELEKIFMESSINQRHISLIADVMTYRGTLMQIDRHGINRCPDNSVIGKASFEEVTDMFTKASIFNEVDKMTGVSANIMFGQVAPCGTNIFDLIFDEDILMASNIDEDEQIKYDGDKITDMDVEMEINKTYKNTDEVMMVKDDDFDFGYSVESGREYAIGSIKEDENAVKVVNRLETRKKIKIIKNKKNVSFK